jgi:hypothetical protein
MMMKKLTMDTKAEAQSAASKEILFKNKKTNFRTEPI